MPNAKPSAGKLGITSGTYDAQARMMSYGLFTYTCGGNGELATKTDAAGGVTAYQYDVFGNLKRVDLPNGDVIQYLVTAKTVGLRRRKTGHCKGSGCIAISTPGR